MACSLAAAGGAGGGRQAGGHGSGGFQGTGVEAGVEQSVQIAGLDFHQGLGLGAHAFVDQVYGHLQSGLGGALAVAGLEHVKLTVLNGELHVLHVLVVLFQGIGNLDKLIIDGGVGVLEVVNRLGSTDAGHHVLALGVHQELTVQLALAGSGIPSEGHAGAGVVTHVAEHHGLDVDGGTPGVRNVVHAPVDIGAGVIPGAEHSLDGLHELDFGVRGKVGTHTLFIIGLELAHQLLEVFGAQLGIQLNPPVLLHDTQQLLELVLGQFHDHVGEHLDEASVGIVHKAGIAGQSGEALGNLVIDAKVQNRVHHARHGGSGTGAYGHQQGIGGVAQLLAGDLFQLAQIGLDLLLNLRGDGASILIITGAGLGSDGEALGDRHAQIGHLSQVGALAAQQLPHGAVALGK